MKRILISILILCVTLTVVAILRESRGDDAVLPVASSLKPSPPKRSLVGQCIDSGKTDPQNHTLLPASERVISTTGKEILLKIYADHTFQLYLPENTNDIFVPAGEKLFTSETDCPDEVPDGVQIKIRNSAGEILTAVDGIGNGAEDAGWYRPVLIPSRIRMPVFSRRRIVNGEVVAIFSDPPKMELSAPTDRISPRVKLSAMIERLPHNIRNQSGLEFKLSIAPGALLNAYDSNGTRLDCRDFPRHETGWFDGGLLFDDE